MDDISVSLSPPHPKRSAPDDETTGERPINLRGNQFLIPTPPGTTDSNESPSRMTRELSPAGSISTLSSIQDVSSVGNPEGLGLNPPRSSTNGAPPAKKRKLTPGEKAEQQRLKEVKAQEKAEQKRIKDEEKRVKDEEKRHKAEAREAKKREKELEEERKRQETEKKQHNQMRLGMFFQRPPTTTQDGISSEEPSPEKVPTRRRSLSLETYGTVKDQLTELPKETVSIVTEPPKAAEAIVSDYRRYFLPYEPKPHTKLPDHHVVAGPESVEAQARFDAELQSTPEHYDLGLYPTYFSLREHLQSSRAGRGLSVMRTRVLCEQAQGSSQQPIDLTRDGQRLNPLLELAKLPVRYLHFHEDVRPPYYGTYTRIQSPTSVTKLRRNPFARERTDTDYDYDSEAEWAEPEQDDEEIDLDEEDEESVGDEGEMEGFLDDENDELKTRRRQVIGDLEAHSSGLCWENESGNLSVPANASPSRTMGGLRLQFLLPGFKGQSIDPFSNTYWQNEASAQPADNGLLRPPLKERSSNTTTVKSDKGWPIANTPKPQPSAKKGMKPGAQKTMSADELNNFKAEVVGSVLSKQELISKLKNSFPNLTAVLVKDTLSEQFAQVGKTKADKKWVYVGSA